METTLDLVTRLYREVLFRDPDMEGIFHYVPLLSTGQMSAEEVRQILLASPEYAHFIQPLVTEIRHLYERFFFRPPSPEEMERYVGRFFERFADPKSAWCALNGGNLRTYLGIRPLTIEMDITNQCNLRCVMCEFSDPRVYKRKRQDIAVADFARLAAQVFPLCHQVGLSWDAEPLLHQDLGQLLAIVQPYEVPHVYLNSNGLLLTEPLVEHMIRSSLHGLSISIDAATRPTYERIRAGGHFDQLLARLRMVGRVKERLGSALPRVHFNFVLMRSNITELPALVRLAHELQVEGVAAQHLVPYDISNLQEETLDKHRGLCNRMLDEARQLAEAYGIAFSHPRRFRDDPDAAAVPLPPTPARGNGRPAPAECGPAHRPLVELGTARVPQHRPPRPKANGVPVAAPPATPGAPAPSPGQPPPDGDVTLRLHGLNVREADHKGCCPFPWHFLVIDWEGEVIPCGWWSGEEYSMGNIWRQSFEKLWNGERYQRLRREHLTGALRACCQHCPGNGMGDVNDPRGFSERAVSRFLPAPASGPVS